MYKLLGVVAIQVFVIASDSYVFLGLVVACLAAFGWRHRRFRKQLFWGAGLFTSFLISLLVLKIIETALFGGVSELSTSVHLVVKGYASFVLLALTATMINRLEALDALARLRVPGYVLSVLYFLCYFIERLTLHAQGLSRAYCFRTHGSGWIRKTRVLLSSAQNFMVFVFIRCRDVPKVMELRGIETDLPIQEWRSRGSSY